MALKKPLLIVFIVLASAAIVSGCAGPAPPSPTAQPTEPAPTSVTASDDTGRVLTFNATPRRIVSLSPSNTETLYALGLDDRIVGVDDYSDFPPDALSKPKVGGMVNVSVDKVVALKPDLALASQLTPAEAIDQLRARGLVVFVSHPRNVTDVGRYIMTIGHVCNVPDSAQNLSGRIEAEVGRVVEKTSGLDEAGRPTVLVIIVLDPRIYVADPGNYTGDLVRVGGGRNLATGPVMTQDEIARADPDVIVVPLTDWTQATYESLKNGTEPWMKGLKAVKAGRVYAVDYSTVGRPGPRTGQAAELMARTLHPELFP